MKLDLSKINEENVKNWKSLPEETRDRVILGVINSVSHSDLARGISLYKQNSPGFHFFEGMTFRNLFREQLSDKKLPKVVQPDGREESNWDDYYVGAIIELDERLEMLYHPVVPGSEQDTNANL